MMNIKVKEAWIRKEIVFNHGGEAWTFHLTEPYVEEVLMPDGTFVPGEVKRIMYFEADDVKIL
jgi:hypothetical protein